MFMKNGKKRSRPLLAVGIGAMALYGAYSMVRCMKENCAEKLEMLTKVIKKKKNKDDICPSECDCSMD